MGKFETLINSRLSQLGITKVELSKRIGFSGSYTTNITNGKAISKNGTVRFHPEVLNQISSVIKVPIEAILESLGFKLSPRKENLSFELTNFINKCETLSPESQSRFLNSMSILIDLIQEKENNSTSSNPTEHKKNTTAKAIINDQEVEIRFI